jgi:hypothetical protein
MNTREDIGGAWSPDATSTSGGHTLGISWLFETTTLSIWGSLVTRDEIPYEK